MNQNNYQQDSRVRGQPHFTNAVSMFSPKQMDSNHANEKVTDIRLKPDIRQMPLHSQAMGVGLRSHSSNAVYGRHHEDKNSHKSALTEFADQRSSARQHQVLSTQSNRQIIADMAESSTVSQLKNSSKYLNQPRSSSALIQSQSSSAFVAGRSSYDAPSGQENRVVTSQDDYNPNFSYVQTTNDSIIKPPGNDHYQAERISGQRTLKECKKALGEDRQQAKAKRRTKSRDKKEKKRKRSKRQPEVVVVYRYPPQRDSQMSSSEQTQTQMSQYCNSFPDLAPCQSAQTSLFSKDHPQQSYVQTTNPGLLSKDQMQILSVTSGFGQDFSNPISPSDLLVPQPNNFQESQSPSGKKRRGANGKELLDSQMVSQSKGNGRRSSGSNSRKSSKSRSKSRSKKRERSAGIQLYVPNSNDSSNRHQNIVPLTSSQLADSQLADNYTEIQTKQQRENKPFQYYKKWHKQTGPASQSIVWSHRPQEVVLSDKSHHQGMGPRKQSHNTFQMAQGEYGNSIQQPYLSRSSSHQSSKFNLADYKTLISQQEQAFEQKLLQVKDHISSETSQAQQPTQRVRSYEKARPIPQDCVSMRQSELQPIPDHDESHMDNDSVSPKKQTLSQTGMSYLSYLNRTTNQVRTLPTQQSEDGQQPKKRTPIRHKSVDNAKSYAIQKIIGRLDTKREMQRVEATGPQRYIAQVMLQQRYQEEANKLMQEEKTLPKDASKGSFIRRFERFAQREGLHKDDTEDLMFDSRLKDQRSHSQIALSRHGSASQILYNGPNHNSSHSNSQKLLSNSRDFSAPPTSYPMTNVVSMRVSQDYSRNAHHMQHPSTYYTLGNPVEISTINQSKQRLSSPLRNGSLNQEFRKSGDDVKDVQAMLTRVDSALKRSTEQLSMNAGFAQLNQSCTLNQDVVQEDSRESLQTESISHQGTQDRLYAAELYEHRLAELQRQSNQVQKLPEFYNGRVNDLKQRTMELFEITKNYTSENKATLLSTQQKSPDRVQHEQYQHAYQRPVEMDASGSFVRQHDLTSSYLREHHDQNHQQDQHQFENNHADQQRLDTDLKQHQNNEMLQVINEDQPTLSAEDYMYHQNEATRHQAVERENIRNDQQYPNIDRQRVLSQQITMGQDHQDLDMIHRIEEQTQPLSQATYRESHTPVEADPYQVQLDQPIGEASAANEKLARKIRRRQKREKKLQKLKQLHDMAQHSMSKIASELTSNVGNKRTTVNDQASQSNLQSSCVSLEYPAMMSPEAQSQAEMVNSVFDEKRDSLRSQVEKLAGIRKEIKKLIKIQNQHGKLLHKLQQKGVIDPDLASNMSEVDLNNRQKEYQVQMSSNMLTQMQEIFKHMVNVQKKLDYEIDERQKRTSQVHDERTNIESNGFEMRGRRASSLNGPIKETTNECQNEQSAGPIQCYNPNTHQSRQSTKQNKMSHGTNSTLFWETQNAQNNSTIFYGGAGGSTQFSNNFGMKAPQQAAQQHQAFDSQGSIVINQQRSSQAALTTSQSEEQNTGQKNDNKDQMYLINHQKVDVMPMPQTNPTEEDDPSYRDGNTDRKDFGVTSGQLSTGNMTLQGIRADQLCEILSREIGRVREESVQHATEMRAQYEQELQALRNEFYGSSKLAGMTQDSRDTGANRSLTPTQMFHSSQLIKSSNDANEEITQRGQQLENEGYFQQQYSNPHEQEVQVEEVADQARTEVQMNGFSQQMFDELQKVKAERDLYYGKLLKVRQRIEKGKGKLPKVDELPKITELASQRDNSIQEVVLKQPDQDIVSQRTNQTGQEKGMVCLEDQRNVRSVNQIITTADQFESQWPSQEVQSNNVAHNTFKHDFSDPVQKQNATTFQSLESNPSSFNAMIRGGGPTSFPNSSQHTKVAKQAGKIVHQTRSQDTSEMTVKTKNADCGEIAQGTAPYVNVRHNRTSRMRQNKAHPKKCQSCLMDTFEDASMRSNRSGNQPKSHSSQERQHCQCPKPRLAPPKPLTQKNNLDSSIVSQSSKQNQRASTPQDVMTFSARGNSGPNSQLETKRQETEQPPSKSIGGGHSIQSMVARSPNLISRLAAEHEQFYANMAIVDSFDQDQQNQQNGGGPSDSNNNTFDNHRASQALSVINHYLEKYDRK